MTHRTKSVWTAFFQVGQSLVLYSLLSSWYYPCHPPFLGQDTTWRRQTPPLVTPQTPPTMMLVILSALLILMVSFSALLLPLWTHPCLCSSWALHIDSHDAETPVSSQLVFLRCSSRQVPMVPIDTSTIGLTPTFCARKNNKGHNKGHFREAHSWHFLRSIFEKFQWDFAIYLSCIWKLALEVFSGQTTLPLSQTDRSEIPGMALSSVIYGRKTAAWFPDLQIVHKWRSMVGHYNLPYTLPVPTLLPLLFNPFWQPTVLARLSENWENWQTLVIKSWGLGQRPSRMENMVLAYIFSQTVNTDK